MDGSAIAEAEVGTDGEQSADTPRRPIGEGAATSPLPSELVDGLWDAHSEAIRSIVADALAEHVRLCHRDPPA